MKRIYKEKEGDSWPGLGFFFLGEKGDGSARYVIPHPPPPLGHRQAPPEEKGPRADVGEGFPFSRALFDYCQGHVI